MVEFLSLSLFFFFFFEFYSPTQLWRAVYAVTAMHYILVLQLYSLNQNLSITTLRISSPVLIDFFFFFFLLSISLISRTNLHQPSRIQITKKIYFELYHFNISCICNPTRDKKELLKKSKHKILWTQNTHGIIFSIF
jgi:hypothetical protein